MNSAGPKAGDHLIERLVDCADLPVVGGQAPQPRLAAMTGKSLLHDVNERSIAREIRGETGLWSAGQIPVFS
jgi:hypothetical protein